MTYSMCCQREISPRRLATLALPATAPTDGSANGCTRRPTVVGSNTVSPSIMTISSWRACGDAGVERGGLAAVGLPDHPHVRQSRSASTISAVPSVQPSSTTSTSTGCSLATSERTVAAMFSFSL